MYNHLRGEITECHPAQVVLRAGGVGYDLKVPVTTSSRLRVGQEVLLHTILHVVDGQPTLLGFLERVERDLSRKLMTVSGVGPAMSLAILSMHSAAEVATALRNGNHQLLKQVKGVGSKTAERLCLELKDHAIKMDLGGPTGRPVEGLPQTTEDAVAALMTLGYSEKEARAKVQRRFEQDPNADTEDLIKKVLRG